MEHYEPRTERRKIYGYTLSGEKYYPLLPDETVVRLDDIAWALAGINRYNGLTDPYVNVAAHSLAVFEVVADHLTGASWVDHLTKLRIYLAALLHDAHEAYTGDIVFPWKKAYPEFKEIEHQWTERIDEIFDLVPQEDWPIIKDADMAALVYESQYVIQRPSRDHHDMDPQYDSLEVDALVRKISDNGYVTHVYRLPPDIAAERYHTRATKLITAIQAQAARGGNLAGV